MTAWIFLLGAALAAVAAYRVGWPAWRGYRAREARDLNAERYLAWRGRAPRGSQASMREGPTMAERRNLIVAGVLAVASVACLIGFFITS